MKLRCKTHDLAAKPTDSLQLPNNVLAREQVRRMPANSCGVCRKLRVESVGGAFHGKSETNSVETASPLS